MRRDRDRLVDIAEAASKIRARTHRGRDVFDSDEDLQIVLTHLIQIIGEAASRLSAELTSAHPEVPWRAIIGMRHRVVHDYFAIDPDILWTAATRDIPHSPPRSTPSSPPSTHLSEDPTTREPSSASRHRRGTVRTQSQLRLRDRGGVGGVDIADGNG